jgi:hypothetical protein
MPKQSGDGAIGALVLEMHLRRTSYWVWSREEWLETLCVSNKNFRVRFQWTSGNARHALATSTYLLGLFDDFRALGLIDRTALACRVFGRDRIQAQIKQVIDVIRSWGFSRFMGKDVQWALCTVLLANKSPTRIAGLVYVDAAFDRGDDSDDKAFNAVARTLPSAPSPNKDDLASFTALRAYLEKYGGAGPEAHVRARWVINPDGTVGGMYSPERPILQTMVKEMRAAFAKPYNPDRIRVPAVSIYAVPKSADDLIRRGSSDRRPLPEDVIAREAEDHPDLRERFEKLYQLTRERVRHHEEWFETIAERGRVVELSGTHHLLISNPREVLNQIQAFVSSLAERR